ncbi:MAG TPA: hypothetical protein VN132_07330, partial [Bdellovibrio sp.]|nr:hypothetical protein [Bdellovibrio sp.]
ELFFQVRSGGCTSKEDFRFEVENAGGMKKVTLYRIRPDECYAFVPFGKVISFSYQELGLHSGDHFYVGNMIQTARVM